MPYENAYTFSVLGEPICHMDRRWNRKWLQLNILNSYCPWGNSVAHDALNFLYSTSYPYAIVIPYSQRHLAKTEKKVMTCTKTVECE